VKDFEGNVVSLLGEVIVYKVEKLLFLYNLLVHEFEANFCFRGQRVRLHAFYLHITSQFWFLISPNVANIFIFAV